MASFKLYLDTRSPKKDGSCPLKIAVNHKGRFLINLKVYTIPEFFVRDEVLIPDDLRRQKQINKYIRDRLVYVENTLNKLTLLGQLKSLNDKSLKNILDTNAEVSDDSPPLFASYFDKSVERKSNPRVKELFYTTKKKMAQICDMNTLLVYRYQCGVVTGV